MSLLNLFIIATSWAFSYGGSQSEMGAYSFIKSSDNSYLLVGFTRSFGAGLDDGLVIKTDADGQVEWAKTYGSSNSSYYEKLLTVRQTSDGGYILGGQHLPYLAGLLQVLLIKIDASGNVQWAKTYGGTNDEDIYGVEQTSDLGYIVIGATRSWGDDPDATNAMVLKLDASGTVQWVRVYGAPNDGVQYTAEFDIRPYAGIHQIAGGYIIGADGHHFGGVPYNQYMAMKINSSGTLQWVYEYGGDKGDFPRWLEVISDGYMIGGFTNSWGVGNYDFFFVKINSSGGLTWANAYGGGGLDEMASIGEYGVDYGLREIPGGYIATGYTTSSGGGGKDIALLNILSNGNLNWARTFGKSGDECGHSIYRLTDGSYVIGGYTALNGGDFMLIKTEPDGSSMDPECPYLPWTPTVTPITITPQTPTIITTTISAGGVDFPYIVTNPSITAENICSSEAGIETQELNISELIITPNVSNNEFQIQYSVSKRMPVSLKIYDALGRLVKVLVEGYSSAGMHTINWDANDKNNKPVRIGTYICELKIDGSKTEKLIKVRY